MLIFAPIFISVTYGVTVSFLSICPYHRAPYKIKNLFICFINFLASERLEVCLCYRNGRMSHSFGDNARMNFAIISRCSPSMPGYIEYKNKTQEKCNYCTIYQCISGFYKKNVELHLLLILAIDSVIYSFYVTILLCKNACFSIKILIFVVEEKISNSSIWLVPRK